MSNRAHTKESVMSLVRQSGDGCWEWQGYRDVRGYGRVRWGGKSRNAHRVVALLSGVTDSIEPSPDNCILHRCDNPPCCRPDHLFVGTRHDNIVDMMEKGRAKYVGVTKKITNDEFAAILRRVSAGEIASHIAREYGVAKSSLYARIKTHERRVANGQV